MHFTLCCCSYDEGTVCESEAVHFKGVGTCASMFLSLFRLKEVSFHSYIKKKSL